MISVIPFPNLSYMIVCYEDHIILEALVSLEFCGMIVIELEKVIAGAKKLDIGVKNHSRTLKTAVVKNHSRFSGILMILGLILDSQCLPRAMATFEFTPGSKLMNSGDINIQPAEVSFLNLAIHGRVYSDNYRKRSPFLSAINGKILLVLQGFLAAEVLFLNVFRCVVVSRLPSPPSTLLAVNQKANIINNGRVPSGTKKAPLTYLAIQISRHAAFAWQGLQGSIINSICFQKLKEKGSSRPIHTKTSSSCDQSRGGNIQNYELLAACS
ncbi:hypothetical protein OIU79_021358 [Salix purpurea]|uniref:Uncharacterized protein n=1 Tax=Salix purpurea TaxID=77065 RepID=A0A9Q0WP62_SALPP|nr:hypothetical protein OIU79_021358 [Salix purpurea]